MGLDGYGKYTIFQVYSGYIFALSTGIIIFSTPNNEDLSKNYICNPIDGSLFHRWQHVLSWNSDSLEKKLAARGLRTINCVETNILWYNDSFLKNRYRRIRHKNRPNLFLKACLG